MLGAVLAKRQAHRAVDAINAMDLRVLEIFAAEEITFRFPARTALSGRVEGKPAVVAWFRRWFDLLERVHFVPVHICVERIFAFGGTNTVVVEWEAEITPVATEPFRATGVTAMEARRGKVVRIVDYVFEQERLEAAYPAPDDPAGDGAP